LANLKFTIFTKIRSCS